MTCPWCGSKNSKSECLLGKLGSREHYCCRYCGGQFSWDIKRKPK